LVTLICFLSSGCLAKSNLEHRYNGYEIKYKYKLLQSFTKDYEVEKGGPILEM